MTTDKVFGKQVRFKKWANNAYPDIETYDAKDSEGNITSYPMDAWLKMLGMFIADGNTQKNRIQFSASKQRKKDFHKEFFDELGVEYTMSETMTMVSSKYKALHDELNPLSVGALNKHLPAYVWNVSQRQARILLDALIMYDGRVDKNGASRYYTSSTGLADDIVRLCLHAGYAGNAQTFSETSGKKKGDVYTIGIIKTRTEPWINHCDSEEISIQVEEYVPYKGTVYCLEIPDTHQHVYYSRETQYSPPVWSGNSSRAGQKGTIGLCLRESDMPSTEDGIRPSIILNPHSIPSRMTVGQLIESLAGGLCSAKCTQTDATIFNSVDIESIATELEDLGLNRYGYRRLYNGITGEYIDAEIFMGPTYYQMLQKFTIDTIYAITNGPSDAITYQPLDGMGSGGGLRIGEMERDVISSHGASRFLSEKFFDHSDGFTEYVCRCGKSAVCNIEKGIYKCNYCKDNADIIGYNNSWSSKLFIHELETLGVGIRRIPEPFKYEITDDKIFEELAD